MRQVEGGGVCWSTEEADWLLCISVRSIRPERGFSLWGDRIERRGGERGVLMTGFTPELCKLQISAPFIKTSHICKSTLRHLLPTSNS